MSVVDRGMSRYILPLTFLAVEAMAWFDALHSAHDRVQTHDGAIACAIFRLCWFIARFKWPSKCNWKRSRIAIVEGWLWRGEIREMMSSMKCELTRGR